MNRWDSDVGFEEKAKVSDILKKFFSLIKSKDSNILFAYVTGITSYGMAGLYSGANNFVNLSNDAKLHSLCGFTEDEVKNLLGDAVSNPEFQDIKDYYNGYSFILHEKSSYISRLFNPVAVNSYYDNRVLEPYWNASSSESIVKWLRKLIPTLPCIFPVSLLAARIDYSSWKIINVSGLVKILYESGYLSIIGFSGPSKAILDFPNQETRSVVMTDFKSEVFDIDKDESLDQIRKDINTNNSLVSLLEFANKHRLHSPYFRNGIYNSEAAWHELFSIIMVCMGGVNYNCEQINSLGRSDVLMLTDTGVLFVIEFKLLKLGETTKSVDKIKTKSNVLPSRLKGMVLKEMEQIQNKKYDELVFTCTNKDKIKSVQYAVVVAVNSKTIKQFYYMLQRPKGGNDSTQIEHFLNHSK